ncbi:MAG: DUF2520 domain-containing protein [Bacteroidota bacterium]
MQWPVSIVLIGAGKVASAMGKRLSETGHQVVAVWSRNLAHADALASDINTIGTSELSAIPRQADLYLLVVPDQAIGSIAEQLATIISSQSLVLHTSGATPASVLNSFRRHGVFYPLQTFSPGREVDFSKVPLCLYTSIAADFAPLERLAKRISDRVYRVSDAQRLQLHLAAVFVNNFTNYMQHIAQEIVEAHELPGDLLLPLLQETIDKLEDLSPQDAQTGPALRDDQATLERHQKLLEEHPHWQALYRMLSEGIQRDFRSS